MKTNHLVIVLVGAGAVAALFAALYFGGSSLILGLAKPGNENAPSAGTGLVGDRLPDFDLPDLAGGRVRSADFTDTPLIIVFWSTQNASSADELHILDQYLASGSRESTFIKIVAVNSLEDRSIVSAFMNRGGYAVETLLDTQGIIGARYALKSLPTFYFVDRTGIVREVYAGMLNESTLINKVERLVSAEAL